jgi:hypothetical protein
VDDCQFWAKGILNKDGSLTLGWKTVLSTVMISVSVSVAISRSVMVYVVRVIVSLMGDKVDYSPWGPEWSWS